MTEKRIYIERLAAEMRSARKSNWHYNDIQDLCELAGLYEEWLNASNRVQEENLAIRAAKILGVEICYIKNELK
jgi:hypothetical protein